MLAELPRPLVTGPGLPAAPRYCKTCLFPSSDSSWSMATCIFSQARARERNAESWAMTLPARRGTETPCQVFPFPILGSFLGLASLLEQSLLEPKGFKPIWTWVCACDSRPENLCCRMNLGSVQQEPVGAGFCWGKGICASFPIAASCQVPQGAPSAHWRDKGAH